MAEICLQSTPRDIIFLTKLSARGQKSPKVAIFFYFGVFFLWASRYLNVQDIQGAEIRRWPVLCLLAIDYLLKLGIYRLGNKSTRVKPGEKFTGYVCLDRNVRFDTIFLT